MAERTIAQENAVTALANERIKAKAETLIQKTFDDGKIAAVAICDAAVNELKATRDTALASLAGLAVPKE